MVVTWQGNLCHRVNRYTNKNGGAARWGTRGNSTKMHIDGRSLASDSVETCDVCIVGSGPAGYAVATALRGYGLDVVVLESGGLNSVTGPHNLSMLGADSSEFAGHFHPSRRQVGGNASAWYIQAGKGHRWIRLAALTEADLAGAAGGDTEGWPLAYDEYRQWVERAGELFDLPQGCVLAPPPNGFDGEFPAPGQETRLYRFGDADRLLANMLELYEKSPEIRLISRAYATEILPSETGDDIRAVVFATEPGRSHQVRAKTYVLAGGGIAIPQLMLASRSVQPEGVGNQNDTVGRWLMDHPLIAGGDVYPSDPALFRSAAIYDLHENDGAPYMGFLTATQDVQTKTGQIAVSSLFFAREAGWKVKIENKRHKQGVAAALTILAAIREKRIPPLSAFFNVLIGFDGVIVRLLERYDRNAPASLTRGGWSRDTKRKFDRFEVLQIVEQRPRRENRITLSAERDAFGVPKAKLDWHWNDEDALAVMRAQDALAAEFEASGCGRYHVQRDHGKPVVYSASARHFMGTTRMSNDPKNGVVDANCRVHGLANLFIVSSSVFPTGGYANPTLSITALGLRLGEHLLQLLQFLPPVL